MGLQGIEWLAAHADRMHGYRDRRIDWTVADPRSRRPPKARHPPLLALAIGVLSGDALIHLLPHAGRSSVAEDSRPVRSGLLGFAGLSRWLARARDPRSSHGSLSISGDALHNLTDGALIALAFAASPQLGLVTTLPFSPRTATGTRRLRHPARIRLTPRKALLANLASASTIFLGAGGGLLLGQAIAPFVDLLAPLIAGSFLYLAGFILLPTLQRHHVPVRGFALTRLLPLTLGLSTMAILALAESWLDLGHPHQHAHPHPTSSEAENTAPNFSPLGSKRAA